MSRKRLRIFSAIAVSILSAFYLLHSRELTGAHRSDYLPAMVVTVHDGDTVTVTIGRKKEKVRLIGIDAPELGQRPWGEMAKRHLGKVLDLYGHAVNLELDVQQRDDYGRLLAYLRTRDGNLINLQMLKDGYAVLFTVPPNVKHVNELRDAQRYAREKGLGIWGRNGLKEMPGDYRKRHPR
jgi:micrococcal nuclease